MCKGRHFIGVTLPRGAELQYEDYQGCAAGEATLESMVLIADELLMTIGS